MKYQSYRRVLRGRILTESVDGTSGVIWIHQENSRVDLTRVMPDGREVHRFACLGSTSDAAAWVYVAKSEWDDVDRALFESTTEIDARVREQKRAARSAGP